MSTRIEVDGRAYDVLEGADDIRSSIHACQDPDGGRPWFELSLDRGQNRQGTLVVNPNAAGSIAIYD